MPHVKPRILSFGLKIMAALPFERATRSTNAVMIMWFMHIVSIETGDEFTFWMIGMKHFPWELKS